MNGALLHELDDREWENYKAGLHQLILRQAKSAHNAYWCWNIVLTIAALAGSAATSVGLTATGTGVSPLALACISWVATFATLATTAFMVKENKGKWEAVADRLNLEETYLLALDGPYAATSTPRRLYVARVRDFYLGLTPTAPLAPSPMSWLPKPVANGSQLARVLGP